jgi:hypothetical protein
VPTPPSSANDYLAQIISSPFFTYGDFVGTRSVINSDGDPQLVTYQEPRTKSLLSGNPAYIVNNICGDPAYVEFPTISVEINELQDCIPINQASFRFSGRFPLDMDVFQVGLQLNKLNYAFITLHALNYPV